MERRLDDRIDRIHENTSHHKPSTVSAEVPNCLDPSRRECDGELGKDNNPSNRRLYN